MAAAPLDPVAQLERRVASGEVKLSYNARHGYLESLLAALKVPANSQGLVFSKTSFQSSLISPQAPRALYFNDDVYVGWVQNGQAIEVASVDPVGGPVFYLVKESSDGRPEFLRQNSSCVQCHESPLTGDVPGLLMRSVYPDRDGMPVFSAGTHVTTEQSPIGERWGGWYVDRKSGDLGMANACVTDLAHPEHLISGTSSLAAQFDSTQYLTAHSDAVALLVLAHQTHLHNLLTQAAVQTRSALVQEEAIRQAMGQGSRRGPLPSTFSRLSSACEPVVQCMFFSQEAALPEPMAGSTDFAREFESQGPFDHQGRSLRQFDLRRRMFRYPCSYLIYSEQFDALPIEAKAYIYRRMWKVLTGRDSSRAFARLDDADRDAIYQILLETKKDLPGYWKPKSG